MPCCARLRAQLLSFDVGLITLVNLNTVCLEYIILCSLEFTCENCIFAVQTGYSEIDLFSLCFQSITSSLHVVTAQLSGYNDDDDRITIFHCLWNYFNGTIFPWILVTCTVFSVFLNYFLRPVPCEFTYRQRIAPVHVGS